MAFSIFRDQKRTFYFQRKGHFLYSETRRGLSIFKDKGIFYIQRTEQPFPFFKQTWQPFLFSKNRWTLSIISDQKSPFYFQITDKPSIFYIKHDGPFYLKKTRRGLSIFKQKGLFYFQRTGALFLLSKNRRAISTFNKLILNTSQPCDKNKLWSKAKKAWKKYIGHLWKLFSVCVCVCVCVLLLLLFYDTLNTIFINGYLSVRYNSFKNKTTIKKPVAQWRGQSQIHHVRISLSPCPLPPLGCQGTVSVL